MFHSDELDAFKGFKAEWISTEPPTIKSAAHGKRVMLCRKNVTGTVFWLELAEMVERLQSYKKKGRKGSNFIPST